MALTAAILALLPPEVTSSQGLSSPLMVHLDSDSVVDVDVEVKDPVDVMDDSSLMVVVLLLVTQGLAALISSLLQPRLAGGSRNVILPSLVTVHPGHDVAV